MKRIRIHLLILCGSIALCGSSFLSTIQSHLIKSETKPQVTKTENANNKVVAQSPKQDYSNKIIDSRNNKPIEGVIITVGNDVVRTNADGTFTLKGTPDVLKIRAPGYAGQTIEMAKLKDPKAPIVMKPFQVRALYLTVYGIASDKIRENTLKTVKRNNMNALVIDVKGDRGFIPFKVDIPLAQKIGAQDKILVKDMPAMVSDLKSQGLYLIARIVVFKDDMLAGARPDLAVRKNNGIFRDREHLRWVDPFKQEVWNYNIAIAKEAAKLGFDEVQFDYVRCPDTKGIVFSSPSTMENRSNTITSFLETAHKELAPYNVMVAADIFGYVLWNTDDTGIGQMIDKAVNAVDVVSPMLYPSGFHLGIPNYRNPVKNSYEIVYLTLKRGQERTNVSPLRFRPWLQAFRDYSGFHGGDFSEPRMKLQIKASNDFGASGYMFWNPRNVYPTGVFDQ